MIDKLDFLLALAREKHFGRAAEACGVSQPSLSVGLKQLEEELGVLLVHRGSRFLGFTPEGERVLEWARRIVGDTRAMRDELRVIRRGDLMGHLRIAVIPTALAMVSALTTPFHARHPGVSFTIRSHTSSEIFNALENLEMDAGITYLDNEPLGRVRAVPLYTERYCLLVDAGNALAGRSEVTWAEAAGVPLCLLTPDMQNRRIIDGLLRAAGKENATPTLESNSMLVLFSHIRTGQWASIMPTVLVDTMSLADVVKAIPIVEPVAMHTVGLVVPSREVSSPLAAGLVAEALQLAEKLKQTSQSAPD